MSSPFPPVPEVQLPELSVLLVDDDEFSLVAMRRYLPSPPMSVTTAINGQAALEAVVAGLPDVVIMDLDMPVMGGFESAARIRAWETSDDQDRRVLIAMSVHDDEKVGVNCFEAGFDRFLVKPVTREALLKALGALALPGPDHIVRLDADLELALPGFLKSRRALIDKLSRAIVAGQNEEVRANAHKLAGGFALYGFQWAFGQSRRIELRARDGLMDGLAEEVTTLRKHLDSACVEFRRRRDEDPDEELMSA